MFLWWKSCNFVGKTLLQRLFLSWDGKVESPLRAQA